MDNVIFMVVRADDPQLDGFEYDDFEDALKTSGALWRTGVENVVVELDPADDFLNDWEVVYEVYSHIQNLGVRNSCPHLDIVVWPAIHEIRRNRYERPRDRVVRLRRFESGEEALKYHQERIEPNLPVAERTANRERSLGE